MIPEPVTGGLSAARAHVFDQRSRAEVEFVATPQLTPEDLHERVHLLLTRVRDASGDVGGLDEYTWGLDAARIVLADR